METSSVEVKGTCLVQSVAHHSGENKSTTPTTTAIQGSTTPLKTHLQPCYGIPGTWYHLYQDLVSPPRLSGVWQHKSFANTAIAPHCYHTPIVYHPGDIFFKIHIIITGVCYT